MRSPVSRLTPILIGCIVSLGLTVRAGAGLPSAASASVDLKNVDSRDGLANVVRGDGGDGETQFIVCGPTADRREGRSNYGSEDSSPDVDDLYLYFNVTRSAVKRQRTLQLEVTAYDDPEIQDMSVDLHYTNTLATGPGDIPNVFSQHPRVNVLTGTGEWVVLRWEIEDAGFRTFMQGAADFRLAIRGGKRLCVDRVDLTFFPKPGEMICGQDQGDVQLEWENNGAYDAIEIARDGQELAVLAGDATSYRDTDVVVGFHRYDVTAVSDALEGGPGCGVTVFFDLPRQSVDPSSLTGKTLCGYQGWFRAPGDGSGRGWTHWSRGGTGPGPGRYTIEMWPDLSEFDEDELFLAPAVTLLDGSPGKLFSSATPKTVLRHFEWMKEYGIDGVFFQRFIPFNDSTVFRSLNQVLRNVRAAANAHGRVFALEYDTSGTDPANMFDAITGDWKYLVDVERIREDPRYLHHNGKPVVEIWGLGFRDRGHTPELAAQIIDFFKNHPTYGGNLVIGGVPTFWRTLTGDSESSPGWAAVYRSWDIINPWMVGRMRDAAGVASFKADVWPRDITETRAHGIGYMPVVWPGFSWDNLMRLAPGTSLIPRRGGRFLWEQVVAVQSLGVEQVFVAMFDEVDEGTAIFKISDNHPVTDNWITLEGFPQDWYLRLTGAATKMLRDEIVLTSTIPIARTDDPNIETESFDFGLVPLGATVIANVVVRNTGTTNALTIEAAELFDRDGGSFRVISTPGRILAGAQGNIEVEFSAASLGLAVATLEIRSDDPFDAVKHATLRATVQPDCDQNGIPDSRDPDHDLDGLVDGCDNCPETPNPDQSDADGDGHGDECDICPASSDSDQRDTDDDGHGDVCDNCPSRFNPDQLDSDGETGGDVCDPCPLRSENTCDPERSVATSVGADGGVVETPDGKVRIEIPAGALDRVTSVSVTSAGEEFPITTAEGDGIGLFAVLLGPGGVNFKAQVAVTLRWDPSLLIVDGKRTREEGLFLVKDGELISDRCESDPDCDPNEDRVTVKVTDFGEFLLGASDSDFEISFRRADANADGEIDVSDVIFSLSWLFLAGAAPECGKAFDSNDDGVPDIADAVFTLFHLFGKRLTPPAPFPGCGFDPSADGLSCESFPACP